MANKKINQLVAKTTIQSTDLFPLGDATTGQLFKKTIADLQAAIGGAVISVNGLTGALVLDTDDIQELASPTNRYFTEARARAAISLTTTGSSGASTYSSSTGVLNVPTYTLAGLGGIGASFLSGGTGITYNSGTGVIAYSGTVYTDASVRALFSVGTGLSYNSTTGAFTNTITQYTDALARAALSGTAPITYNSTTGAISISQATTSTNGYLSSTDWNTFNGKQSALTLGNFTEATSSVLTITGGTGAIVGSGLSVQVKLASGSQSGYLSSTDWTTFNSKQGTITLTTTGTSGAATFSGGTLNIPQYQSVLTNPVTGTGTSGYHAKWTSGTAIGNSNLYDSGSNVGLGTTSPAGASGTTLEINGVAGQARLAIKNNATGSTSSDGLQIGVDTGGAAFIENRGTNSLQLNTNGSARLFITSAGNVGIGTSSPSAVLHVIKDGSGNANNTITGSQLILSRTSAAGENLAFRNTGTSNGINGTNYTAQILSDGNNVLEIYTTGALPLVFGTNATERMRISSEGYAVFGGTSTTGSAGTGTTRGNIIMAGSTSNKITFNNNSTTVNGYLYSDIGELTIAYRTGSSYYLKTTDDTIRQVVTAGGNTLLGTSTDNGERLYVSGSIRATGSITANSDVRLKKNIERIENALQKVTEISGYTYNTIYDEDRHAGVIAQEIDKVLPEIVNKGNDGLMGVEYGNISALLIEAIKEQKGIIDSLQARLSALEK